ncbi:MAG: hypothetical protein JWR69_314 [Pedosphaera sp.]|nr:hypothetical protein [Pedosphaera sp.]
MIAMRHGFVAAPGAVDMVFGVSSDVLTAGAAIRVLGIDLDHVFFDTIFLLVFQMARLQVICVSMMLNGDVAATRAVVMFFGNAHIRFR